jgi:hypothetical protein
MTVGSSPHLSDEHIRRFVVDAGPWMSCDECFDRLDEYVERVASATDEWLPAMASHLTGCLACREEAESLLLLLAEED